MRASFHRVVALALLALPYVSSTSTTKPDAREALYLAPGAKPTERYLGKRATSKNGLEYPEAGTNPPSKVPQAWLDKYKAAKSAGLIPDIPVPKLDQAQGLPVYPAGSKDPCNWEVSGCYLDDSPRFAPDIVAVVTADDGPSEAVNLLIPALTKHNVSMTHFLIGSQIIYCPECLQALANAKPQQHFGSHSFTHVQLATFTDEQVVADLGWTNQLIYDYTGYVPLYWRAPQGDVDLRVNAIAKHVFGLQHVFWTHDADDWCILDDGTTYKGGGCQGKTPASIAKEYKDWASANPKVGVINLSHEIRKSQVDPLIGYIEDLIANKWTIGPVPALGTPWYSNAVSMGDKPMTGDSILPTSQPFTVNQGGRKIDLGGWKAGIGGSGGGATSPAASNGTEGTISHGAPSNGTTSKASPVTPSSAPSAGTSSGTTPSSGVATRARVSFAGAAIVLVAWAAAAL